jgi:hypothetical protein
MILSRPFPREARGATFRRKTLEQVDERRRATPYRTDDVA